VNSAAQEMVMKKLGSDRSVSQKLTSKWGNY